MFYTLIKANFDFKQLVEKLNPSFDIKKNIFQKSLLHWLHPAALWV